MKFLRPTAHVVSIVMPLLFFACATSAALQEPRDQEKNQSAVPDQNGKLQVGTTTEKHNPTTDEGSNRHSDPTPYGNEWSFGDKAPVWSNWALAIVALFAGWIAYRAFSHERDAIKMTERAYLSCQANGGIYQDATHRFEAHAKLANTGTTPAYNITFKADISVVSFPIPDFFEFPLTGIGAEGASVSYLTRGAEKLILRTLPNRLPDAEAKKVMEGGPDIALLMWGIVNYTDAFKKKRFTKFAFTLRWLTGIDKDGKALPPMWRSADTKHHNEAD